MGINLGSNAISSVKLGTTQVDKVYLGSTEVWSNSAPQPVPDYGRVVLYGYSSTSNSVYDVDGGTAVITDDNAFSDMFMYMSPKPAQPLYAKINGQSTSDDPYNWEIIVVDANSEEVYIDPWMLAYTVQISSQDEPFSIAFYMTYADTVIDKTTTNTVTLASVNEFNSLVPNGQGFTMDGTVPTGAVKSVTVGKLITATPSGFLGHFESIDSVDMSNAESLTTIGIQFMLASSINSPIIIPEGVTSIGNNFMGDCRSFNSDISLPSTLTIIDSGFMSQCEIFSKPVVLPSGLVSLGRGFLNNMGNMTSYIDVGNLSTNIMESGSSVRNTYLSYYNSLAPGYPTGMAIKGANRAEWLAALPNGSSYPARNLRDYGS